MPGKNTIGRVRGPGLEKTPPRDEIVVQRAWPTRPHAPFEGCLAELSAAISVRKADTI